MLVCCRLPLARPGTRSVGEERIRKTCHKVYPNHSRPEGDGRKPCIRGLRVTIGTVVGLWATGESRERFLKAYPYLEVVDLDEALTYVD
ncbi:MAG: DUF433 domain-containing protein [Isosphaeraceae bacterium]